MDSTIHFVPRQALFGGDGRGAGVAFLTHLVVEGHRAPSAQNQALAALLLHDRVVLGLGLQWLDNATRAEKPARLPVVLSEEEVRQVLAHRAIIGWRRA